MRLPLVAALLVAAAPQLAADYPYRPVSFTDVRMTGGFWQEKQEVNRQVTVPFSLKQCEDSGRLTNFDLAAETLRRRAHGEAHFQNVPVTQYPFDDSDAYKAIMGAGYVLGMNPDAALEARLDAWIARIAAAQEPDGYLYTFRTMHPDSPVQKWIGSTRWETESNSSHELYDSGHLFEAGVTYYQATGKRALLDVALRNADLLWREFGDGRRRVAPGPQVVEMGLVKLYRATNDRRYLDLAKAFLDARGPGGPAYSQQHLRVVDQDEAVGHAVRANYMYSGMADVAALTGDPRYQAAITAIWQNVVGRKLYLTGGVGALAKGEAYGEDYELPNDGYGETCAAVALMMWNHRMFLLSGDAKYMDVFERTAYNGFLSGVSLSGDRFFYCNPQAYDGQAKNNAGFAGRAPWFGCACCPPNLLRMIASITGYVYAVRDDALFINLYAQSEAMVQVGKTTVKLSQETDYPWKGDVRLRVSVAAPGTFTLKLRIPGWVRGMPVPSDLYTYASSDPAAWSVRVAGEEAPRTLTDGYVSLTRAWHDGDTVELTLPMPVREVSGNPRIAATRNRVAFERGPLLYCVEDTPEKTAPDDFSIPSSLEPVPDFRERFLGGVTVLELDGARVTSTGKTLSLTAIPYFAWNNRGLSAMGVWLPKG